MKSRNNNVQDKGEEIQSVAGAQEESEEVEYGFWSGSGVKRKESKMYRQERGLFDSICDSKEPLAGC